ncbi:MAG: hypothetical protein M9894_39805 [Planctomycetes bacterium]|nr:hypothetical protein [Planctomycetota bacterium]
MAASLAGAGPALERGLLRAVAVGRAPEVIRLLERHGARFPADVLARLRASAALRALPDAVLPPPRGPLALPDGEHPGALVAPATGLELSPVRVGRRGRAWWLALPTGTRVEGAAADLAAALGQPLDACEWVGLPDDPGEAPARAAVPVLTVR